MSRLLRSAILLTALLAPVSVIAQASVEFERERMKAMLSVVAREVEKNFYDEELKGVNWQALVDEARARIEKAESPSGMVTAIFSLVNKLQDSHTVFISPEFTTKFLFGFEAKAFGNDIRIYELRKKGVAEAAGLRLGDQILSINGFAAERDSLQMMMLYFRRLRPISEMVINYRRAGQPPATLRLEAKVERGQLIEDLTSIETIYKYIREAESDKETYRYAQYNDDVGYIVLPSFTASESFLRGLVNKIKDSKAVVVDLRGNPGGSTDTLSQVVGFFESEPLVMADIVLRKKAEPLKVKPKKPGLAGPMVIIVDSQSASAAEMFTYHFKRTGRAVVIGDQTSGRVTASRLFSHRIGLNTVVFYGIQIAVGRVVFPDGIELEKRGVTPDHMCLPSENDLNQDLDPCLNQAVGLARKALGLGEEPTMTPPVIKR